MEPIFTDKQLNNMSREDLISLMKIVQEQTKKKDTEIQLLKDKQKELEFLNAMLSDRLTLAQRKQFGASSEKYAEDYEQMNLFNEAEANEDAETEELFEEIRPLKSITVEPFHQAPESGPVPLKDLYRSTPTVAERNMQREYGSR